MQRDKRGYILETVIRMADVEDAKGIEKIEKECFSAPWSAENVIDSMNMGGIFLVAETEGEISGYCGMMISIDEGYITNVAVGTDFRRRKIGEKLITALIEESKKRNLAFITLEVRQSNIAAQNLYKKFGFEYVGKRPRFYSKPVEDALLLTVHFNER